MWIISVEKKFSSAHQLVGYSGDCSKLHGHNFKVKVSVKVEKLTPLGISTDFRKLKLKLEKILSQLDHKNLNQLKEFKNLNPTSENIAKFVYNQFVPLLTENETLQEIEVWEGDESSVKYIPTQG